MQKLICGEWVLVDHPFGIGQIRLEGLGAGTVDAIRLDEVPVELIQQKKVPSDLEGRDDVAPAGPRLPVQKLLLPLGGRRTDGNSLRRCRLCELVGGGALLRKAPTRRHEGEDDGTGEERPKEFACMLTPAHPRRVAEPAFVDRAWINYWMPLTN